MFGNLGQWLLRAGAWAVGFTPTQLAKIESVLPNVHALIAVAVKAQPVIEKMAPLVDQATPLINEAIPLVKKASEEMKTIGPVLELVIDVIEKHTAQGKSQSDAIKAVHAALSHFE